MERLCSGALVVLCLVLTSGACTRQPPSAKSFDELVSEGCSIRERKDEDALSGWLEDVKVAKLDDADVIAVMDEECPNRRDPAIDWIERVRDANSFPDLTRIDDVEISGSVLRVYTDATDDGQAASLCFDVRAAGWTDDIEVWGLPGPQIRAWTAADNSGCVGFTISKP